MYESGTEIESSSVKNKCGRLDIGTWSKLNLTRLKQYFGALLLLTS